MSVPVVTISNRSTVLDPEIVVISVEIRRELNGVPSAALELLDGRVAERRFEVSDLEFFKPGNEIEIALRYEGRTEDTPLFRGLVVRHTVEGGADGSRLRVELKDRAFTLTRQRKSAVFRHQRDDEAIRALVTQAGLEVGRFAHTRHTHDELVQYHASDWDFLVSRADVEGMVVDVDQGKVSVQPLELTAAPKRKLVYGDDLFSIELEIDGGRQWAQIESVGWDAAQAGPTAPERATPPVVGAGNLDAGALASELGGASYTLLHPAALTRPELKAWADARLARSRFSMLRGRAVIAGDPSLAPLDTVELEGVSERFNGKVLVSAVTHRVDLDGWQTELELGLSPDWFARLPDIAELPAGGLLPPISGVHIATVAPFEDDPLGQHRVKVLLPALNVKQEPGSASNAKPGAVWARVARPDAGPGRGFVFWPEPGDEVVVGFLDGDPRQAVVLGALHGAAHAPPAAIGGPSEANGKRAIVSRAGATIGFDDDHETIIIESPGKNKIRIEDQAKAITIADQHGNTITLDDKGITLKSNSDLTLEAAGKVAIKGSQVDVQ